MSERRRAKADERVRWIKIALGVAAVIGVLVWGYRSAKDNGFEDGRQAVYSDYSDLSYLASTEMCDRLARYELEDLGADFGDPSLADDAVNLVLYAEPRVRDEDDAGVYEDYPDDLGESTLGIKAGIVLDATTRRCPEYLPVVAAAVERYADYQSDSLGFP